MEQIQSSARDIQLHRIQHELALQRIRRAIADHGALKEVSHQIGVRRGWKRLDDEVRTLGRWCVTVLHKLSPTHPSCWALADHWIACEVLGYDPLASDPTEPRQAA